MKATEERSVAEVRRCLLAMRSSWARHSPDDAFNLTMFLPNGERMDAFSFAFVLSHHDRRMHRLQSKLD